MIRSMWTVTLLVLLAIFAHQLLSPPAKEAAGLVGEPLPAFQLTDLVSGREWTNNTVKGQVSLINIWATWCDACALEHPILLSISKHYRIPIYSIDYKDNPQVAKQWLAQHGNPYSAVGSDHEGQVALDFGIYGTPETFVINRHGYIVYRHVGAIDQTTWEQVLYPLILKYQQQT